MLVERIQQKYPVLVSPHAGGRDACYYTCWGFDVKDNFLGLLFGSSRPKLVELSASSLMQVVNSLTLS